MPDLGPYATEVLLAYAGSLAALALIVGISLRRHARVRREVERAERDHG
jgi:heme exporter protein D